MPKACIIIGAGHAAAQLAQSLRQESWEGSITIVGEEAYLPYHRPPLSKAYLMGEKKPDEILIRAESMYAKLGVEFKLNQRVTAIDRVDQCLTTDDGQRLRFDRLVICTGSRPREVSLPGSHLHGVCYLRSIADVEAIKKHVARGKHAVIIGGGYIGLETASVLRKLGMDVTVLEMMDRVLQRVTCTEISEFFARVHTEEGVTIETGVSAESFVGQDHVEAVLCHDGSRYAADLVIIGAGIVPNVELAEQAGLDVENGIIVDEFGQTADSRIFAAGDCTNHPNALIGCRLRLESVPNAVEQAKTVAAAICNKEKPYAAHPWFWSDQYDIKLQIAGLNQGYDEVLIRGDSSKGRSFVAWYLQSGQLIAADCVNRPKEFVVARQLLSRSTNASPDSLVDESVEPKSLLS